MFVNAKSVTAHILWCMLSLSASQSSYAEGCEDLLAQGVFDTFNASSVRHSYNEWHQWWCNGTIEKTSSGSSTGAKLNVVVAEIPLGLSFDSAQQFQRVYQQQYCGTNSGIDTNLASDSTVTKIASKDLLSTYESCKRVEKGGISSHIEMGDGNRSFVLQMRYNRQFEGATQPNVTDILFLPKNSVTCSGNLKINQPLNLNNKILACNRLSDHGIQIAINTDAGAFTRNIAPKIPPPTSTELVLAALPSGTILAWAGKLPVPLGWRLCDGQAGTPDLRDRYPEGAADAASVGTQLGQSTHTHRVQGNTNDGNGHHSWHPGTQFEIEGGQTHSQDYHFDVTSDPADNSPPTTKIQFIMKL